MSPQCKFDETTFLHKKRIFFQEWFLHMTYTNYSLKIVTYKNLWLNIYHSNEKMLVYDIMIWKNII